MSFQISYSQLRIGESCTSWWECYSYVCKYGKCESCSRNDECRNSRPTCRNGMCEKSLIGEPCTDWRSCKSSVCKSGKCDACNSDTDCISRSFPRCDQGTCTRCKTENDCRRFSRYPKCNPDGDCVLKFCGSTSTDCPQSVPHCYNSYCSDCSNNTHCETIKGLNGECVGYGECRYDLGHARKVLSCKTDWDCMETYFGHSEEWQTCNNGLCANPCDEKMIPCSGRGECTLDPTDTDDERKCNCSAGYTGKNCETDPCDEKINPCSGQGECTLDPADTDDGRKCNCTAWYSGDNCETDPCDEKINPCSGHGECTLDADDIDDGRKCNCTVGYTGDNCETDIVDGGWSEYGDWGECANGLEIRRRKCDSPAPKNGGACCVGDNVQTQQCKGCADVAKGCLAMKNSGYCTQEFFKENCRKTCGLCG